MAADLSEAFRDSPERVALDLVKYVAWAEGRDGGKGPVTDAKWVFSTYRKALAIVQGREGKRAAEEAPPE